MAPDRRLQWIAVAMAAVAVIALPLAIAHRRHRHRAEAPPPPVVVGPAPRVQTADAAQAVVAMFGSICRHEVACGIGDLGRCDYIEQTMRQVPGEFALKPCVEYDARAARQCLVEIAERSCADFAKSLDVTDLAQALDRITSCRRTCR